MSGLAATFTAFLLPLACSAALQSLQRLAEGDGLARPDGQACDVFVPLGLEQRESFIKPCNDVNGHVAPSQQAHGRQPPSAGHEAARL